MEVILHTIFSDCKNLQKYALTNVNIQRTGKTSLQMFVYFIFDGNFICGFYILHRQVISLSRLANNSGFLCIFVEDKLHLGNAIVQAHCYCSRFAL